MNPVKTRCGRAPAAVLLLLAFATPAECTGEDPYELFSRGQAGTNLLRTVARGFLEAATGVDEIVVPPSPETGRPAGPRDELPPPEWPAGPVGSIYCVESDRELLACEGNLEPRSVELAEDASRLGERLAGSRSRSRRGLRLDDTGAPVIRGAFILEADRYGYDEARERIKSGASDLSVIGLAIEGSRGVAFVMPGEAASWRKAIRLARKGRAVKRFGSPPAVYELRLSPIGPPFRLRP